MGTTVQPYGLLFASSNWINSPPFQVLSNSCSVFLESTSSTLLWLAPNYRLFLKSKYHCLRGDFSDHSALRIFSSSLYLFYFFICTYYRNIFGYSTIYFFKKVICVTPAIKLYFILVGILSAILYNNVPSALQQELRNSSHSIKYMLEERRV